MYVLVPSARLQYQVTPLGASPAICVLFQIRMKKTKTRMEKLQEG